MTIFCLVHFYAGNTCAIRSKVNQYRCREDTFGVVEGSETIYHILHSRLQHTIEKHFAIGCDLNGLIEIYQFWRQIETDLTLVQISIELFEKLVDTIFSFCTVVHRFLWSECNLVALDVHEVSNTISIKLAAWIFLYTDIRKALSVDTIHFKVFPDYMFGLRIAGVLCQPRRGLSIINLVSLARDQFDVMYEAIRIFLLCCFKGILCRLCQFVAEETSVVGTCAEVECQIAAVLNGSILQGLTACHGTRTCQIVAIVWRQALATISPLGDTKEIDAVGVDITSQIKLAQEFFPCPLLTLLPPAIVISGVGDLRNKVNRRTIFKTIAKFDTISPFIILITWTMQIEEQGIASFGASTLFAIVIVHYCIVFEFCGQCPTAMFLQAQFVQGNQAFFVEGLVGFGPCLPYGLLLCFDLWKFYGDVLRESLFATIEACREVIDQSLVISSGRCWCRHSAECTRCKGIFCCSSPCAA